MSFVDIRGLRKSFGPVTALDDVSLAVEQGSRLVVVGPSGCGKTTLLRLIAGFETPDAGSIAIGGEMIAQGAAAMPAYRRNVGIVAQDGCLFPHLSVEGNIVFGMTEERGIRTRRAAELMDMVGLDPSMLLRRPDELSGGQQQRVALARALARKPRLMLLDEPFSALDTGLRAATRKAVGDVLRAEGIATLLVTHDQAEALAFADRLAIMRAGRIVQIGAPRDVYSRPTDPQTAAFLGEAIILPARVEGGHATCALGRVAVDGVGDHMRERKVLLRPEQIAFHRPGEIAAADGVAATVKAVSYRGPTCEIRVSLGADEAIGFTLDVPASSEPTEGQDVILRVTGRAHIFG